ASLSRELCRFLVLANLGIGDGKFRSEPQLAAVFIHWLVVQFPVHNPPLVIAALHNNPHPLAGHAVFTVELDLNVVTRLVVGLALVLVPSRKPAAGNLLAGTP